MSSELILKKLEQIQELLNELERLLAPPFEKFIRDLTKAKLTLFGAIGKIEEAGGL